MYFKCSKDICEIQTHTQTLIRLALNVSIVLKFDKFN